ncbi:DUF3467 domain-containing protein [candidate division KSB1 bacterium]|nr:DUF3467 domain-containing protein [candidate division KSB1 bacterium]
MDEIKINIIPFYPNELGLPKYCNYVQIKFTPNEFIFDFGFVDPIQVNDTTDEINAEIISRVCMNHKVGKLFLDAFKDNMTKFEKISKKINDFERKK